MQNLFCVRDKVVLVTGGSRGIGEMIAEAYVANGAKVYISSRKAAACEALASRLSEQGRCVSLPADLSSVDACREIAAELGRRETGLDVLVNNAGASWGAPIDSYPEEGWDKVLQLNLTSPFFLTQALLPLLRSAAGIETPSRIINIASINGIDPPDMETYAYSASKSAMIMLTRHMAKRLARDNILVNAIAPGPFATKMMESTLAEIGDTLIAENPLRRLGTPGDIGGVALFLGSRASAYTTGATIPCDGGLAEV